MTHLGDQNKMESRTNLGDARGAMIRGTIWSVAMRWSIKGLGLISTVILARILSPGDYGIVAMAMLVVGLAEVLVDFGSDTALLRQKSITKADINSAWSLRIIQGLIVSTMLAVAAPLAGLYFNEPRVVWVIWVFAICVLASSFGNIGATLARKELNFGFEFRLTVISKLLGVAITIVAAYLIKDYRALVIGVASGYIVGLLLSYLMHPYRPAWCTSEFRSMWSFSKWLLVSGIGYFAARKVDEILAGRIGGADGMGVYTVGADIGQLPTAEIGPPINRTLLPTLSTLHDEPERMRSAVLKTVGVVSTLTLPLGVGMAFVAEPVALLLLGEKWRAAIPFIAIFAIGGAIRVSVGALSTYLMVLGDSKFLAHATWIEFVAFLVAAAILTPLYGLIGLAEARLLSSCVNWLIFVIAATRKNKIRYRDLGGVLWRPLLGIVAMAIVLSIFLLPDWPLALNLALQIITGAISFVFISVAGWWLAGKPDSLESLVVHKVTLLFRKFFQMAR